MDLPVRAELPVLECGPACIPPRARRVVLSAPVPCHLLVEIKIVTDRVSIVLAGVRRVAAAAIPRTMQRRIYARFAAKLQLGPHRLAATLQFLKALP